MLVLVTMITTIRNTSRPDLSWTRLPSIREQCRVEWWAATAQIDRHRWRQAFKKIQVRPTAEDRSEDKFLMEGFSRLSLRKKKFSGRKCCMTSINTRPSVVLMISLQRWATSGLYLNSVFFLTFQGENIAFSSGNSRLISSSKVVFFLLSLCPSLPMSLLSLI